MSNTFCQSCGATLEPGAQFCKSCGAPVATAASAASQPVYQAAPPVYQQPAAGYAHGTQSAPIMPGSEPLTVGQYLGMMLLGAIPLVGFIMYLIWAFGSEVNINRKNYSRAVLIMMLIGIALSIFFGIVMAGFMATMWRNFSN